MTQTVPALDLAAEAGISGTEYTLIALAVLAAVIFLFRRVYHRKTGCAGCGACSGNEPCKVVPASLRLPPDRDGTR